MFAFAIFRLTQLFGAGATLDCLSANGGSKPTKNDPNSVIGTSQCDTGLPKVQANGGQLHTLLQITLGIFAVITVLMIIISALNILYGEGDPQKVAKARGSIIYALIGLVVAVSAEVIVTFVIGKF